MSMRWHLLNGQGGLPNSASKTHTPPANPRRTPLCHPDHHLKREERRQAVGLICAPFKRVGVGLGIAYLASLVVLSCPSGIQWRIFAAPRLNRRTCINAVSMSCYLLNGQRRFADSASKTDIFPKKQITGGYYVA